MPQLGIAAIRTAKEREPSKIGVGEHCLTRPTLSPLVQPIDVTVHAIVAVAGFRIGKDVENLLFRINHHTGQMSLPEVRCRIKVRIQNIALRTTIVCHGDSQRSSIETVSVAIRTIVAHIQLLF